jgi:hypothetical protein
MAADRLAGWFAVPLTATLPSPAPLLPAGSLCSWQSSLLHLPCEWQASFVVPLYHDYVASPGADQQQDVLRQVEQ